jgi:hypothetical protein
VLVNWLTVYIVKNYYRPLIKEWEALVLVEKQQPRKEDRKVGEVVEAIVGVVEIG